jgi:hypothetical protein
MRAVEYDYTVVSWASQGQPGDLIISILWSCRYITALYDVYCSLFQNLTELSYTTIKIRYYEH